MRYSKYLLIGIILIIFADSAACSLAIWEFVAFLFVINLFHCQFHPPCYKTSVTKQRDQEFIMNLLDIHRLGMLLVYEHKSEIFLLGTLLV